MFTIFDYDRFSKHDRIGEVNCYLIGLLDLILSTLWQRTFQSLQSKIYWTCWNNKYKFDFKFKIKLDQSRHWFKYQEGQDTYQHDNFSLETSSFHVIIIPNLAKDQSFSVGPIGSICSCNSTVYCIVFNLDKDSSKHGWFGGDYKRVERYREQQRGWTVSWRYLLFITLRSDQWKGNHSWRAFVYWQIIIFTLLANCGNFGVQEAEEDGHHWLLGSLCQD